MPRATDAAPVEDGRAALLRVLRDEGPRVLATLIRTTGSWQIAEDAVQDAVLRALQVWPRDGVPVEPRAWLSLVARRCAIDQLRREALRPEKERDAVELIVSLADAGPGNDTVGDDLLRLLFTCCHPSLPVEAQIALALRTLCGLTTAEVASALLVGEATMAKRLTRAKRKIAVAKIPYQTPTPADFPQRIAGVLSTIYLLFNEGYHATAGESPLRSRLTSEAIQLAEVLHEQVGGRADVVGLRALLLLQDARRPARVGPSGSLIPLCDQDRTLWVTESIELGLSLLGQVLREPTDRPDPYTVQAAIAACHDLAPSWEATNWTAIVSWYDVLLAVADTPVVRLNRAIAIGQLHGAGAGLDELALIESLDDYLPFASARAELLTRAGRVNEARQARRHALTLPGNAAAKTHLTVDGDSE